MVELELNKVIGDVKADFKVKLKYRINIVTGDSATGKSFLIDGFINAINNGGVWNYKCNKNVIVINTLNTAKALLSTNTETLFIMDENITDAIRSGKQDVSMKDIEKSRNYFLIFDRQSTLKIECNVKAVFKLVRRVMNNSIEYRLESYFGLDKASKNNIDVNKYKYLLSEDAKSGKVFFKNILTKLITLDLNGQGNGAIARTINKDIVKSGVLIALDYDVGSISMQNIINKVIGNEMIGNIGFIPMESFEELICNSEFILDAFPEIKDLVINYEDHMDASVKHSGKYFSKILHEYIKQTPPILKSNNGKNITKFYEKGAKHIETCITHDCCEYNYSNECRLYVNGNKQDKMLSNKFAWLNAFR